MQGARSLPLPVLYQCCLRDSFGTDNILGFIAYGKKIGASQDEIWTTPELGSRVPLRLVNHAPDGVGYCSLEAVEISREPEPANFFDPPDLPMDLSVLNRWLEKARVDGLRTAKKFDDKCAYL